VGKAGWQVTRRLDANSMAAGKPLPWDIIVADTVADSYVSAAAAAAEQAADRKSAKYDQLVQSGRLFQPTAAEMLGPLNESPLLFFAG